MWDAGGRVESRLTVVQRQPATKGSSRPSLLGVEVWGWGEGKLTRERRDRDKKLIKFMDDW